MIKTLCALFVGLLLVLPMGFAQNAFPELESDQVTKDEIYWSHAVRQRLFGQPERLKDFLDLVQAYTLKDKTNPQKITQLDRIRYAKYADQITGGRPELMMSEQPDIQRMLFNGTVGTERDFLIDLRRESLQTSNADVPVYRQARQLFAKLDTPVGSSANDIIQSNARMALIDREYKKIIRDVERSSPSDYLIVPGNVFAAGTPKTGPETLFLILTNIIKKNRLKHLKKALKLGGKIAGAVLDKLDLDNDEVTITFDGPIIDSNVQIKDLRKKSTKRQKTKLTDWLDNFADSDTEQETTITFKSPIIDSNVYIALGDYGSIDTEHLAKQTEKLLADQKAASKQIQAIQTALNQRNTDASRHESLTKTVHDKLQELSKKQLTKRHFDRALKTFEASLSRKMDANAKKLVSQLITQTKRQQRIERQGKKTLAVCREILKHMQAEERATVMERKAEIDRQTFKMTTHVIGQSYALAANIAAITGGSEDLVKTLTLASEVVPQAIDAISALSKAFSGSELTYSAKLSAVSGGLTLASIGLKIMSFFMGGKSADHVTHEYLMVISKQIRNLHRDMLRQFQNLHRDMLRQFQNLHRDMFRQFQNLHRDMQEQFRALDAKVMHLIKQSEKIYTAIIENRDVIHAIGDELKKVHQDRYLNELIEKETYLQMMIETKTPMPNSQYAELVSFFATFANQKAQSDLFVGHRNLRTSHSLNKLLELHRYHHEIPQPVFPIARVQDYLQSLNLGLKSALKKSAFQTRVIHPEIWRRNVKNIFDMVTNAETLMQTKSAPLLRSTIQQLKMLKENGDMMNRTLKSLCDEQVIKGLIELEKYLAVFCFEYEEFKDIQKKLIPIVDEIEQQSIMHDSYVEIYLDSDRLFVSRYRYGVKSNRRWHSKRRRYIKQWAAGKRNQLRILRRPYESNFLKAARTKLLNKALADLNAFNVFGKPAQLKYLEFEDVRRHKQYVATILGFLLQLLQDMEVLDREKLTMLLAKKKSDLTPQFFFKKAEPLIGSSIFLPVIPAPNDNDYALVLTQGIVPIWMERHFNFHIEKLERRYYTRRLNFVINEADIQLANMKRLVRNYDATWMHPALKSGIKLIESLEPKN